MKDNIDSTKIFNRKIIIELRFKPVPKFLDTKGTLIGDIEKLGIIKNSHWILGDSAVKISDSEMESSERNRIHLELNRLSFVSTKIDSISDFYGKFEKIYNVVKSSLGELDVIRIGCRIQGSYKTKSTDFESILCNFKESFPSGVFVENFPVNDLRFQIIYQNGMYHIGPIKEDDPFLKSEFPFSDRKNDIGIGIDTDNYLLKTSTDELSGIHKIKDVLIASLSVEKSLVDSFCDF